MMLVILAATICQTNAQTTTMRLNAEARHQHITGFGGFVCSPQFGYNHMSQTEIKRVWGNGSTVGCNIMRLYIPIGRNAWSQSLQTAKQAKQAGLIVFASPWGQPAEWKTNGTINAKNSDGTIGKLKRENWPDYAQYLEDYVKYLRQNGVELDAISIQNEPDWQATYAGCIWSASEIAEFVKTYGRTISCRIIAPETLAVSDSYVNELNKSSILPNFDIYGGHQYGGIQSGYKKLAAQGKEIWMTEYLINWNENQSTSRNFNYDLDVFNFFRSINTCMLGDFNAWIHYAAKRYYGMLGDGQYGTSTGTVTKRGYVMAHFARFVTGMTRIDQEWPKGNPSGLEGSAYISQSGDTVVAVVANPSTTSVKVTVDLPFYTLGGKTYTTTRTQSLTAKDAKPENETCRPEVEIAASSVTTILFIRSRDRQPSLMEGSMARFDLIEDQIQTNSSFGTTYKISGKSRTFDHSNPLISTRTTTTYGYLELTDRFSQLVMDIKKVTSTLNYTSAKTTLHYVNDKGEVKTHDYGELDLNRRENFSIVFDLSPATLPDGCRGLLGISNDNWSSKLTITFGDVYLSMGNNLFSGKLSGPYSPDDSNVLDYASDPSCTSIDMTAVTNLDMPLPWSGSNRVTYLSESALLEADNMVKGNTCKQLTLTQEGGDFRPTTEFQAEKAELRCKVEGKKMIMLPFTCNIPDNAKAYLLNDNMEAEPTTTIPAHQPVLVDADGEVTFTGSGEVAYAATNFNHHHQGTYIQRTLYPGDYVLDQKDGQWGFLKLSETTTIMPFDAYALLSNTNEFVAIDFGTQGINEITTTKSQNATYSITGQHVGNGYHGIVIKNGKKYVMK